MYPYFPEEQVREAADALSRIIDNDKKALYIHRDGLMRFLKFMNTARMKVASVVLSDNPEIYDLFLVGKLSPNHINGLLLPNYADVILEISDDFSEIVTTVSMLQVAQEYLESLQDAEKDNISHYVQYHLSNQLNEFFILTERMGCLLKTVKRLYRKDTRSYRFEEHFQTMRDILHTTMNQVRQKRNYHVHQKRYTDAGLRELESIEFKIHFKIGDPKLTRSSYLEKVAKYYEQWLAMVKETNMMTVELLNLFFGILERFLFSEQGSFLPPVVSPRKH